jgi:predicted dehydrogenase
MTNTVTCDDQPVLSALIVGLGVMGSYHLRILSSFPGVQVAAVVERDDARRTELLRAHPGTVGYRDLEDALAARSFDFACLAVPVGELPRCAAAVVTAGVHAFVEKPMARDEELAHELVTIASDREVLLGVGFVERFNPAVMALKAKLDAGMIGGIVQMHARRLSPFPNRGGMAGVALDLATHDIDLMRFLSGSEVERVYAESTGRADEEGDDLICATLRFDAGCTGLLEANWITPTKVRELSVLGEGGMFVVNYLTQELMFYEHPTRSTHWEQLSGMRGGREGDMIRYALDRREPLRVQWEAFVEAVRTGGEPAVSGRDALAALSTARAIQRSGGEHQVTVPDYREAAVA